jgi:hypothetical protein
MQIGLGYFISLQCRQDKLRQSGPDVTEANEAGHEMGQLIISSNLLQKLQNKIQNA